MPFTLSHPAMIIPLRKWAKADEMFAALVIGSCVPDLIYFLPHQLKHFLFSLLQTPITRDYAHTFTGLWTFCLPLGILLFFLYRLVLAPSLFPLLPSFLQKKCSFLIQTNKQPWTYKHWVTLVSLLLLGAGSHLFWDAWTSRNGFFVQFWPTILNKWILFLGRGPMPIYAIIYYLSTLLGLAVVLFFAARFFFKQVPETLPPALQLSPRFQWFLWLLFFVIPTVCSAWQGWLVGYPFDGFYRLKYFLYSFLVLFLLMTGILLLGWVLLWHIHRWYQLFPTQEKTGPIWKKELFATFLLLCFYGFFGLSAFVINGTSQSWKQPKQGQIKSISAQKSSAKKLRVLAYNIAHCKSRKRYGLNPKQTILTCLERIAAFFRKENPDIILLSEVDFECTPCQVRQLSYLAKKSHMPFWLEGESLNFGLPFYRIRAGVGILSKFPLRHAKVQQLPGPKPFYWPVGNRRILWASFSYHGQTIKLAAIHNESTDPTNNEKQVRFILKELNEQPALLGGDFNSLPTWKSIKLFQESQLFTAKWNCPYSFPAHKPDRCIDNILAPNTWKLLSYRVAPVQYSDHLPVIADFQVDAANQK